jgi:hypothetical protein
VISYGLFCKFRIYHRKCGFLKKDFAFPAELQAKVLVFGRNAPYGLFELDLEARGQPPSLLSPSGKKVRFDQIFDLEAGPRAELASLEQLPEIRTRILRTTVQNCPASAESHGAEICSVGRNLNGV